MTTDILVPNFGESITEGTVSQWVRKEGDFVNKDDILLEIESEKATQGIPSPASGVLHLGAKPGDRVQVGAVLGRIDESAKPGSPLPPGEGAGVRVGRHDLVATAAPVPPAASPKLSPAARRVAAEAKVDPAAVEGTGRHGVILKEDVQAHLVAPVPTPPPSSERERRVPMSAIRQRIAERLVGAQKATASLTTFNEVDMSAVMELRTRYKDRFKETHGVSLGFMSFFVKASIEAMKAYPLVNAAIDGRDIVYHDYCNIGVAVSTEKGLMVPVLHDAETLTFAAIEKVIGEMAVKARDGKISVSDLQGGTFTITNGGIFGSMLSTPILNYPQSAILGMHAIQKRAVVRDDQIVIRPMMCLALTYDHRLIDGKEAVQFLVRIKECIEDPQRLLLSV
ncbi:MAG: 2-oxoglutarate dehydrogenase complex dihydrolipoyllysine-residue succinyltransferase [Gemmataceae bacterium]|nr:2-oxoglutarate dehydrogenase complex dihydrolipoyllysine-residue succinyltransferase [Gemmataceae bacterium]